MKLFGKRSGEIDLESPQGVGRRGSRSFGEFRAQEGTSNEVFGRWSEGIARNMGTPWFLLVLSIFCVIWLVWNTFAPDSMRFDSAAFGFTALTLILSLQASYAAPLILLAQNRQDDRDRVQIEQDRQRAERNLADTEFLAREVVALRHAIQELPDRDFVRAELRALLAELAEEDEEEPQERTPPTDAGDRAESTGTAAEHTESPDGSAPVPDSDGR